MDIKKNLTGKNYNTGVISRIKYIVVHYTANDGDTAYANTEYFKEERGASAHYFVDENNIYQSIEDKNIAWHCGANKYYHMECRNSNSLGIELCSRKDSGGNYYFKDGTIKNAVWLIKMLMKKYSIPIGNVIRHYDVTRKICPEPFVRNSKIWENFKAELIETEESEMVIKKNIDMFGQIFEADVIEKDGFNYIKMQDLSKGGKLSVSYDANAKLPAIDLNFKNLVILANGENKTLDKSININGTTFVGLREIIDNLSGSVKYDENTKQIEIDV